MDQERRKNNQGKSLSHDQIFFNQELSWIAFNNRVLFEASNKAFPLLERLRFLSISAKNLDEFFMIRVAKIYHALAGTHHESQIKLLRKKLDHIHESADEHIETQRSVCENLFAELTQNNIHILEPSDLKESEQDWLKDYFEKSIFPLLTPIAFDPAHPLPTISNLSLSWLFHFVGEDRVERKVLLTLPSSVPRFIKIPARENTFILSESIIAFFSQLVFSYEKMLGQVFFRIIRDSEIGPNIHADVDDLMTFFESVLKERRKGTVVKLEAHHKTDKHLLNFILDELDTPKDRLYFVDSMIGLNHLDQLIDTIHDPSLLFEPYPARTPPRLNDFDGNCFDAIASKDLLIHHPFETFNVVVKFLQQAAFDPQVLSIKQTLYRIGKDSPIAKALIAAAEAGKSVTALIELQARFDEETNIEWARAFEKAGVQVIYGVIGLKMHAKIALVVRKEGDKLKRYCHFGTGNYHRSNAQIYTDLSFFTADDDFCDDASKVFNFITGNAKPHHLKKIACAPLNLRETLYDYIDQEIENAKAKKPAAIWAKMNALTDHPLIEKLYEASCSGVKIYLIVRGICCLRPGIKGLSENIFVKSVVGRFLEHSRIICFAQGEELPTQNAAVFVSSSDWMPRNLNHRVECLIPIDNLTVKQQILNQIMIAYFCDEEQSWILQEDGTYTPPQRTPDAFCAHDYFMKHVSLSGLGKTKFSQKIPELSLPVLFKK